MYNDTQQCDTQYPWLKEAMEDFDEFDPEIDTQSAKTFIEHASYYIKEIPMISQSDGGNIFIEWNTKMIVFQEENKVFFYDSSTEKREKICCSQSDWIYRLIELCK